MKKQYNQPSIQVYKIQTMGMLLTMSRRGDAYSSTDVTYAPGMDWDDDDEDEY